MFTPDQVNTKAIKVDVSAGAIVFRGKGHNREVLVVHRNKMNDVSLPKGHSDFGESLQETAKREVLEETGYTISLTDFIEVVAYQVETDSTISYRTVYWFRGVLQADDAVEPIDPEEIDYPEWVKLTDIQHLLTYDNDKAVIEKASAE